MKVNIRLVLQEKACKPQMLELKELILKFVKEHRGIALTYVETIEHL